MFNLFSFFKKNKPEVKMDEISEIMMEPEKEQVSDFTPVYHKTKSCPVCHAQLMKRGIWWVCSRYPEEMQLLSSELNIPFKR